MKSLRHIFVERLILCLGIWIISFSVKGEMLIFPQGHHFSLSMGYGSQNWQLDPWIDPQDQEWHGSELHLRFQYAFHLPWDGTVGYLLGSGFGVSGKSPQGPLKSFIRWEIPGVLFGVVLNPKPHLRYIFAYEAYLTRLPSLSEKDVNVGLTLLTVADTMIQSDIFYDKSMALRLEGHVRWSEHQPPGEAYGTPLNLTLSKYDAWAGVGWVYHLL